MKSSGIKYFQFLRKSYETMSNRPTASSHSNTRCEKENVCKRNHTEVINESLQSETPVEPKTNPTDNTRQNPLQIPEASHPEIFTEQISTASVELQQPFIGPFHPNKLKLELSVYDYDINEELKLQIKHYKNKNWKVNKSDNN